MSEKYLNYGIKPEQSIFLEDLEKLIGKPIPEVEEIEEVPFGVKIDGENIVELRLYNRQLTSLPESIGNLTSLKVFYLRNYAVITFPDSIANLKSLKKLYLRRNMLINFPDPIIRLRFLEELNLWSNNLTTLPESIKDLENLKVLDVSFNQLKTLPNSLGKLTSLKKLNLENNKLTTLPKSITNLKSLEVMYLGKNQLSSCLELIMKLESLQSLALEDNKIRIFPESIGNLVSLEVLYLNNNKLTTLPKSIINLKYLKELNLWGNKLTKLPESIVYFKSLKKLDLTDNQLKFLPESIANLTSLEELNLSGNELTSLPDSFGYLKNLKTIDLRGNKWKGEWKGIDEYSGSEILDFCKKRTPIKVFITHSRLERDQYRIIDIHKNLKKYEEISEVYIEEDKKIEESQILIFIATKQSLTSKICMQEIGIALKNDIEIIPIKGMDIKGWEELNQIDLREAGYGYYDIGDKKGFEFDGKEVEKFCNELYAYIKQYKREFNLFESQEKKLDKQKENIKNIVEKIIESDEFRELLKENLAQIKKLSLELRNKQISLFEYISRCGQILNSKLK